MEGLYPGMNHQALKAWAAEKGVSHALVIPAKMLQASKASAEMSKFRSRSSNMDTPLSCVDQPLSLVVAMCTRVHAVSGSCLATSFHFGMQRLDA